MGYIFELSLGTLVVIINGTQHVEEISVEEPSNHTPMRAHLSVNHCKEQYSRAKLHGSAGVRGPRRFFTKSVLNHCFVLFYNEVDPGVQ